MRNFSIGDTVQVTGAVMTGNVGTVVSVDTKRDKYLVRITDLTQNYFTKAELTLFELR
jgi:ribosomal protein L24